MPPAQGGAPLLLQADGDGNSAFESSVGDTVPPGTRMRVSADGAGVVRVRANGETLLEQAVTPGTVVELPTPPRAAGSGHRA